MESGGICIFWTWGGWKRSPYLFLKASTCIGMGLRMIDIISLFQFVIYQSMERIVLVVGPRVSIQSFGPGIGMSRGCDVSHIYGLFIG